jgi:hypothetical protein
VCPWAFPEDYKLIMINDENKLLIKRAADSQKKSQAALANEILRDYFNRNRP